MTTPRAKADTRLPKLEPCPFCGGPAVSMFKLHGGGMEHTCGNAANRECAGHLFLAETEQWNTRLSRPATPPVPRGKPVIGGDLREGVALIIRRHVQAGLSSHEAADEIFRAIAERAALSSPPVEPIEERKELCAFLWHWWRSPKNAPVYPNKAEPDVLLELLWNAGYRKAPPVEPAAGVGVTEKELWDVLGIDPDYAAKQLLEHFIITRRPTNG